MRRQQVIGAWVSGLSSFVKRTSAVVRGEERANRPTIVISSEGLHREQGHQDHEIINESQVARSS